MTNPQFHQLNFGGLHNVSRQANSQNAGYSNQAQPGGLGGGYPNHHTSQSAHQLAANFAANNLLFQRLQAAYGQIAGVPPSEPLKTEKIVLGEIIAWRGWRVGEGGFLHSMSSNAVWAPGEPMEGKTKSREEHNGVYAYKTAKDFLTNHANDLDIYGKVALWGDIIEHELGYRAQFAKVISLEHFLKRRAPFKINIKDLRARYCAEAA